jgi:hypothetical protein
MRRGAHPGRPRVVPSDAKGKHEASRYVAIKLRMV